MDYFQCALDWITLLVVLADRMDGLILTACRSTEGSVTLKRPELEKKRIDAKCLDRKSGSGVHSKHLLNNLRSGESMKFQLWTAIVHKCLSEK